MKNEEFIPLSTEILHLAEALFFILHFR